MEWVVAACNELKRKAPILHVYAYLPNRYNTPQKNISCCITTTWECYRLCILYVCFLNSQYVLLTANQLVILVYKIIPLKRYHIRFHTLLLSPLVVVHLTQFPGHPLEFLWNKINYEIVILLMFSNTHTHTHTQAYTPFFFAIWFARSLCPIFFSARTKESQVAAPVFSQALSICCRYSSLKR